MKVRKGNSGYIRYEKKKRLLVTLGMFVMPLLILIAGLIICKGDKNNIFTVIAVVGCLPGCKSMVGLIMMMMQKPASRETVEEISSHRLPRGDWRVYVVGGNFQELAQPAGNGTFVLKRMAPLVDWVSEMPVGNLRYVEP